MLLIIKDAQEGMTIQAYLQSMHFSRHQISRLKFRKDGIRLQGKQARVNEVLHAGDHLELNLCDVKEAEGQQKVYEALAVRENVRESKDQNMRELKKNQTMSLSINSRITDETRPACANADDICGKAEKEIAAGMENISVLYEDACILIVNKPRGIVCHPSHGHWGDTMVDYVRSYLWQQLHSECHICECDDIKKCVKNGLNEDAENHDGAAADAYLIGRLDKDTSGCLLFAKNQETAALLADQRERGILEKTYLALCEGEFQETEGVISDPIAKDPTALNRMMISPDGKPAETHYRVIQLVRKEISLVKVQIKYGRTHQIRLHMASIGHPLLGDPIYGGEKKRQPDEPGQKDLTKPEAGLQTNDEISFRCDCFREKKAESYAHLHAWRLQLQQPFTGEMIRAEAPWLAWKGLVKE